MATYPAIAATSEAMVGLLESAAADSEFAGTEFELYQAKDLQQPMASGVSVYLYRVAVGTTPRNLRPRTDLEGRRYRPSVPLDLHYLVTAWAGDAVRQQRLLGWCARALEDAPVLPAGLLNHYGPEADVFEAAETVELVAQALSQQELSDIWEVAQKNRQPSLPYVARMIAIDSRIELAEHAPVQTRRLEYAKDGGG